MKSDKKLYNLQKFLILQTKINPATNNNITDGYAYAWYNDIYPFFDDSVKWHEGFEQCFEIKKERISEVLFFLDENWLKKKYFTFYQLESHYGGRGFRSELISILRYAYLSHKFDDAFWKKIVSDAPIEAHTITYKLEIFLN
ncbi:MAG: hypothetical protein FWH29_02350 [Methanobrevibacter sp.]|nr:hypothetical protein [Methanobrevibacter sp.]